MEILYLSDNSQLDSLISSKSEMLREMWVMTGDMAVSFALETLGIEYIDAWNFICPDEIKENKDTAYLLSASWWDESVLSTEYEGFQLADAMQRDLVYPFEACLNAKTIYTRVLKEFPVRKIYGYFSPQVGVIRTGPAPTSRAVSSLTEAVLFYIAEKKGIAVEKLHAEPALTQRSSFKRKCSQQTGRGGLKNHDVRNCARKTVLVYETVMPVSEHVDLIRAIQRLPAVETVSISQHELEQGVKICGESDPADFLELFREAFVGYSKNYCGSYPEIFSNYHLFFQFECIMNEMKLARDLGNVFSAFLDSLNPSVVIFGHEGFTRERVLVRVAKNRGIPTATLFHGGLCQKIAFRGIVGEADHVMLWNETDVAWITNYEVNASRICKIGSLRYALEYEEYLQCGDINVLQSRRGAKKYLGLDSNKPLVVLITAEINTGFAAPLAEPAKHRATMNEFVTLVDARQDLQFMIKPHPSFDYYEMYKNMLAPCRSNLVLVENASMDKILDAADICLLMNYCTTASLEAMLHRVPLIYLNNAAYPLHEWQEDSLSKYGIARVKSIAELEVLLDRLLADPELNESFLDEADQAIKGILDIDEGASDIRLLECIVQILGDHQNRNSEYFPALLEEKKGYVFSNLTSRHSAEQLMYVFASLAGSFNLGLGSLFCIFNLFRGDVVSEGFSSWQKVRWNLIPVYIEAYHKRSISGCSALSNLRLFAPYVTHPHKIFSVPMSFWKNILRFYFR